MSGAPRYYPQFYRTSRPYVAGMERLFDVAVQDGTVSSRFAHDTASRQILEAYSAAGITVKSPRFSVGTLSLETSAALAYGQWRMHGAKVFDFSPELCEAFLQSDVDDIRLSDLHFPYPSLYAHFGPQEDLPLHGGALVAEGAYLLYAPGESLRVVLTARYADPARQWFDRSRECYQLNIRGRHFSVDLGSAIDSALADDLEDLRDAARKAIDRSDMLAQVEGMIEAHQQNIGTFRKALRLVVNGLCYLTAYPDDAKESWQPDTPERLRQKAESGETRKERDRAASKLVSQGFLPAHRVGEHFAATAREEGTALRRVHWRRGHWRRQAHGPARALRRLVWIRPTRVSGTVDSETTGGVFKVVDG